MRARSIVVGMALTLVAMAFLVEHIPPTNPSLLGWLLQQEVVHLLAHTVLYGALAAALAQWRLAPMAEAPRRQRGWRALGAALSFLAIAATQELVQVFHRGRRPGSEEFFDLLVDGVAACVGLLVWTNFQGRFRVSVARALGVLLHPVLVGPAGVFALAWSSTRDAASALRWTAYALGAAASWMGLRGTGLRRKRFSTVDLSVPRERPALRLAAPAMAGIFAAMVYCSGAPPGVRACALAGLLATAIFTLIATVGVKASRHAAVPVGVITLLEATSHRGLWPFAMATLAVSWARIQEGRHTLRGVAMGWSIAGASALLARQIV